MKIKTEKQLTKEMEKFNSLYPVGTELELTDDYGFHHKRKLLSEAWIIGGHSVVAKFEGISGCYNIDRVQLILNKRSVK